MTEKIAPRLKALSIVKDAYELSFLLNSILTDLTAIRATQALVVADITAIKTRSNGSMLSPAGLAIGGGSKLTAQAVKPFMAIANGIAVYVPAATSMSVLPASTTTMSKFGLWAFYIDSAGTITTSARTAEADTAAAAFALMPSVPTGKTQIGCIIVTDSNSTFVAGTDALDASGVTVIYIDNVANVSVPVAQTSSTPAALTIAA